MPAFVHQPGDPSIQTPRTCTRSRWPRPGAAALALALFASAQAGGPYAARAAGRFGDSTWVAPGVAFDSLTFAEGPRVAPRDHERPAETILRTPFRVAFFPLRLVAWGLDAGAASLGPRYLEPKPQRAAPRGARWSPAVYAGTWNDIGIGPAVAWRGFPGRDGTLRAGATWSPIDRRHADLRAETGTRRALGFALAGDYDSKPNTRYYGIGNDTPRSNRSILLLETIGLDGALHVGASPLRRLRLVAGYRSLSPRGGYFGQPRLEDAFPPASVPFEGRSVEHVSFGVAGDLAALDEARDPARGVHGRAELRRALGVRAGDPDLDTWRVEARGYVPVFARRRVLALRGVYEGVSPRGGAVVPFDLLAQSAGDTPFAGYPSGRFRDRQLALFRAEYRWRILYRLSAVGLYELGEVAPRAGAFRLRAAHRAWGGGLRYGLGDLAALRFELAGAGEGLRATLATGSDW